MLWINPMRSRNRTAPTPVTTPMTTASSETLTKLKRGASWFAAGAARMSWALASGLKAASETDSSVILRALRQAARTEAVGDGLRGKLSSHDISRA